MIMLFCCLFLFSIATNNTPKSQTLKFNSELRQHLGLLIDATAEFVCIY